MTKKQIIEEFREKFVTRNPWKDASEETAYAAVGNLEDFLSQALDTYAAEKVREERKQCLALLAILLKKLGGTVLVSAVEKMEASHTEIIATDDYKTGGTTYTLSTPPITDN